MISFFPIRAGSRFNTYAFDTTDEESDTDESKDISDQDKALFEERLNGVNTIIEADNIAEDAYIASLQHTFTWTGGADTPECYKSTDQVQPRVESSLNISASHYEITTA